MRARERQTVTPEQMKSAPIPEACQRYGVGRDTMRKIAEDANAIIRIGKCVLVNYTKVDTYMDAISQ